MTSQRSEQWLADRLGVITSTRAHDLLSSPTTRKTLMAQLISEHATALKKEVPQTAAMIRGSEIEDEAVSYYQIMTDAQVHGDDSYLVSRDHPLFACSPDGLVGEDGGIEIKRLDEHNHIKTMLGDIDKKYLSQIKWCLFVTGRKWWDYVGYCETMPEPLTSDIRRLKREDLEIEKVEEIAFSFVRELEENLIKFGIWIKEAA